MRRRIIKLIQTILSFAVLACPALALAQNKSDSEPARHFRIEKPGQLDKASALTIYQRIKKKMAKGYGLSRNPLTRNYIRWRQFNSAPYLSATHGNRYINNYGNAKARRYNALKTGDKIQTGAVLVKDSFTVTRNRGIFAGAMFVMQKLAPGRSPKTADWRYFQIMPDGSLLGDSIGDGAAKMKFCHSCHRNASKTDYLFNIPAKYKRQFLD